MDNRKKLKEIDDIILSEKISKAIFIERLFQDSWKDDKRNWRIASKLTEPDKKRLEILTKPQFKWV